MNANRTLSDERIRSRLTQWRPKWPTTASPTADDITYGRMIYADPCSYCGQDAGVFDHIEAGIHGWENLKESNQRLLALRGVAGPTGCRKMSRSRL